MGKKVIGFLNFFLSYSLAAFAVVCGVAAVFTLGLSEAINKDMTGKFDWRHEYVYVIYKCKNCGTEFFRLYEFNPNGKKRRDGRYSICMKSFGESSAKRSYKWIEEKFDEMDDEYDNFGWTCAHFSKEFFNKIS